MTSYYISRYFLLIGVIYYFCGCLDKTVHAQTLSINDLRLAEQTSIITGAGQTDKYIPLVKNKTVGLVCNHTSRVGNAHMVDTLISSGINIAAIFSPEHGFRGEAGAGDDVKNRIDYLTGIPVISLYGSKKKPAPEDMNGIDIMIFDIQDVGIRFYTYLSTLSLVMEACAEHQIPLIVLDRPNPNAFYIDGPVLDTAFKSFVGMHPVPIVYGMTIGEYAKMVNGEGWLKDGDRCDLTVIPIINWHRDMIIRLPVKPSPNLPNWQSVYLYPSLCLFEGTVVSVGRGTGQPFQVIGHPGITTGNLMFIPRDIPGVAENPPYLEQPCYGQSLTEFAEEFQHHVHHFTLVFLINYYNQLALGDEFFNNYFDKLAGNDILKKQIQSGMPEDEIRKTWDEGINAFQRIREKYLLYPDNH